MATLHIQSLINLSSYSYLNYGNHTTVYTCHVTIKQTAVLALNLRYKDSPLTELEHAAQPEFFSFWLFLTIPPLMYTFTVLYTFWKHALPRFFVSQLVINNYTIII